MSEPIGRVGGPDPEIAPEGAAGDAKSVAREQFMHGLLGFLHQDSEARQERRIERVLEAIGGAPKSAEPDFGGTVTLRWQKIGSLAAAILIVAGVLFMLVPMEQSATATVRTSISALRSGGDRRYEVRVMMPDRAEFDSEPMATVDLRDSSHLLVRARTPRGDRVTLGRDEQGKWIIKPDGELDRFPPRQAWPRWLNIGESTVLLESVDSQLEVVLKEYELKKGEAAGLPRGLENGRIEVAEPTSMARYERVTAVHKAGATPEPERIEMWIERDTRLVKRMELHWPEGQWGQRRPEGGARPMREGDEGGPQPARPMGPIGPMRPMGPMGERPPRGARPQGPGPDDGPREGRDEGGPPRLGPDGQRPPLRDGRPEDGPMGPGPGGRARPRFLDGPPEFGPGGGERHPPPPRVMVFERVEDAKFAEGWFKPETHVKQP